MSVVSAVEDRLQGWPDRTLSAALAAVGLFAIAVAIWGRPAIKPVVLAWMLAP